MDENDYVLVFFNNSQILLQYFVGDCEVMSHWLCISKEVQFREQVEIPFFCAVDVISKNSVGKESLKRSKPWL